MQASWANGKTCRSTKSPHPPSLPPRPPSISTIRYKEPNRRLGSYFPAPRGPTAGWRRERNQDGNLDIKICPYSSPSPSLSSSPLTPLFLSLLTPPPPPELQDEAASLSSWVMRRDPLVTWVYGVQRSLTYLTRQPGLRIWRCRL